jgi:Rhs element Vgr protein
MNVSIPTPTQPAIVVTKKIFVNGEELSKDVSLTQITVNKMFNKISYAKLVFQDGSVAKRDFTLSNDNRFKPGSTIKVQLGFDGSVDTIFEGIIVRHAIKVRMRGISVLMIEAKDKAIQLTGARKSAYYISKKDSDVIDTLATGLAKDIDTTSVVHDQLVQFDTTDWDFIVMRAEANGMLVLTDDGKLVVKKPSTSSPSVFTATYGQNIWEFEGEMDARRQVNQITGHSWDYTKQSPENSQNGTSAFSENGNISSSDLANVLNATVTLRHTGYVKQQELQNWSDAWALRNKLSKAVGRVRVKGNASVKPGTMITLQGVGDRFSGDVFVTGVLHQFENMWQTDIQFGWREEWFSQKEDLMQKPASGLLPGVHGLQIGIVTDVDDSKEKEFRVKVYIPAITDKADGIWARVATLDAGSGRGIYFRPQLNDEVVLGFLNDDPRDVIIVGYLHSKNNASPLPIDQGKLQYGIVTQEKLKLIFDDSNKRMSLIVPSGSGEKSIIINSDASAIELKDENQNSIKMDAQGITIQSGKTITIKGQLVKIN